MDAIGDFAHALFSGLGYIFTPFTIAVIAVLGLVAMFLYGIYDLATGTPAEKEQNKGRNIGFVVVPLLIALGALGFFFISHRSSAKVAPMPAVGGGKRGRRHTRKH